MPSSRTVRASTSGSITKAISTSLIAERRHPPPTNSDFIGLYFAAVNGDATSPGCLCEGFGIAANGIAGYANEAVAGIVNLAVDSFTSTTSTAVSTSHLTSRPTLQVVQDYHPSISTSLYEVTVTLTNTGAAPLNTCATTARWTGIFPRQRLTNS